MPTYPPHPLRKFRPTRHLSAFPRPGPRAAAACLAGLALTLALGPPGCSGTASSGTTERYVTRGLDASERSVSSSTPSGPAAQPSTSPGRPAATLNGEPIPHADLAPLLAEASGGQVLEELILDRLLNRECARAAIAVTDADIRAERDRLLEAFTGVTIARDENEAMRLLERVRSARGLGDRRFAALLRRNAMLRALVAPQVAITPAALQQARALRFGERYRVRLIVTTTAHDASQAIARLRAGESFSALAAQISTDVSAVRGGVIDPINAADPEYPSAIRTALRNLKPGEPGIPIALDNAYAILLLDEIIPASAPADTAAAEEVLVADVRIQQERLLMNQYARRLLSEARVTVLDREVDWSWQRRSSAQP